MAYILGIESSCDDTSAAVLKDDFLLSNFIASQDVHKKYGGVVPEWASRAHLRNIVPTIDVALSNAGIARKDLSAIAFTRGPGLLGSLLVGVSFAKAMGAALDIPIIRLIIWRDTYCPILSATKNRNSLFPNFHSYVFSFRADILKFCV